MKNLFLSLVLAIMVAQPGHAQSAKIIADYETLETILKTEMRDRNLVGLFRALLPTYALHIGDLQSAERNFRNGMKSPLTNHARFIRNQGENGFFEEVHAFWADTQYAFILVRFHEREEGLVIFQVQLEGDLGKILAFL